MIDCGKCGGEDFRLEDGIYTCRSCGKTYSEDEVRQRETALDALNKKRKLLLILMAACMVFLIISAALLPGYTNGTRPAGSIFASTGACVVCFIAALVVRIQFGRDRKRLYTE